VYHFLHAVAVFIDDLAAVRWKYLVIALALQLVRLNLRAIAWRAILVAAYPGKRIRLRHVFGAYVAGVGVNAVVPARGGDAVKIILIKRRIEGATYATVTPTLIVETIFDFFVAGALIAWALSLGVLPTHQVYSRLPSVDWGFFLRYERETAIGLAVLAALCVAALIFVIRQGREFRARVAQGFAILKMPRRFLTGVIAPQTLSWFARVGSLYYFLLAFGVHASLHNALLAMVVDSLATLFPATPGGAGTKQGLIVFIFRGQAVSRSLLLAFSVGMNIALVVFNLALGLLALAVMAGTISFRRVKEEEAADEKSADRPASVPD
jgi:uncharacterized membrane protein YbhN (UPF0104 family)